MAYLHEAIKEYFAYPQVKWILAHGADVNAPDEDGNPPLALSMDHFAEHHTVVKGLLRRGASLDARNRQGLTALMVALDHSNIEGAELLAGRYRRRRIRPAVDPTIDYGRLALLYAAFKGDVKAARQLLDAGTDPNARNSAAQTPIMMAVRANQPGALRLLLERGADPNVMDVDGRRWTALHMAASDGLTECARLLLEHGADVNSRDDCQRTPLFEIAFSSSAPTC